MARRARAHSGVGGVAGHFSKSARNGAPPRLFRSMLKNKPALYFVVKAAHPPLNSGHPANAG
jgi:hypothetical protein